MTPQQFVQTYLPFAQATSAQTGLPVDYILGQSALETGWGSSGAAVNGNNFFGISPGGSLASYDSPSAGFAAYGSLLSSNYDLSGLSGASAAAIAQQLNDQGYSETPDYASRVSGTTGTVDSILSSMGLGSLASSGGAASGSSGTGSAGSCSWCAWLAQQVGNSAGSVVFVVLGIVLLLGALYLFGSQQGMFKNAPPIVLPVE